MGENRHTKTDLQMLQALPLDAKIKKTQQRIREWVNEFGIDGVYISFSGGKDSLALLHLARQLYPDIKAMHVNTGLEFPEIEKFVKTFDNVDIIKPDYTFVEVVKKYGYPMLSKEIAECVSGARKYLREVLTRHQAENSLSQSVSQSVSQSDHKWHHQKYRQLCGLGEYSKSGGVQKNQQTQSRLELLKAFHEAEREQHHPFQFETDKLLGTCGSKYGKPLSKQTVNKSGGCGNVHRFSLLTGIKTSDGVVDARLWNHYRQFASAEVDGNQQEERQSNDGEYP